MKIDDGIRVIAKAPLIAQVIGVGMLTWALVPINPYAYYMILRVVICGIFIYLAVKAYERQKSGWVQLLGIAGVIYNPIVPFHLGRDIWSLLNVVTIALLVVAVPVLRKRDARMVHQGNPIPGRGMDMEQRSVGDRIKDVSGMAFGGAIFLAILSIPALFILGSAWAAKHLLHPLITIGWIAVAVDILVLLPLSVFRVLRGFTGTVIFISSFIFGLVTWLLGFILTYSLWGFWAVVIGILFFGAVVPFALLATLFKGMWDPFFTVLVLLVVTFGSRTAGMYIAESGSK